MNATTPARRVTSVLLGIIMLMAGMVATAPFAHAAEWPPVIDSGGGNGGSNPPGGGVGGGGGAGGGGGGGGTTLPPSARTERINLPASGVTIIDVPRYGTKTCGRKADGRYAVAVTYLAWYGAGSGGAGGSDGLVRVTNVNCVYPPSPILTTIYCPLWLSGVITGPQGNPVVSSRTIENTGRRTTAFENSGRKDLSKCGTSPWTLTVRSPITELGKYTATVQGRVAKCTRRDYPGSSQPSDIKSCSLQPVQTWTSRAALWCNGYSTSGWPPGHSYTMDECLTRGTGTAQCTMNGAPKYGGLTGSPVEAFHDGRNRTVAFPALRVTGQVRNVKVSGTTIRASGTPAREGAAQNGDTQPYVAGIKFGTKYAKDITSFPLNFQSAGFPGKPFTVNKTSTFTAQFLRQSFTITALDLRTGQMSTSTTQRWVSDRGTCVSRPLTIDVLRARNTN